MNEVRNKAMRRRSWLGAGAALAGLCWTPLRGAARPVLPLAIGDGSPREFVLPLLQLVAEGGDFDWDLHFLPWARLLAQAGRGDMLAFGLSRNERRERQLLFSEAVFTNHVWLVVRAGEPAVFAGLESLRGRTLCLTRGVSYGAAFDAAHEQQLFRSQQVSLDLSGRLRMLAARRCDALPTSHRSPDPAVLERRLRERGAAEGSIVVQRPPMHQESIHFVAARGHGQLAAALSLVDAGLRARRPAIQALVAQAD